ncbi:hypothetical protein LIER_36170 [Lithospermum erythrorhizon]|uniref:Mitochondrial carrier protein MTM1 n=1 Tax=Lithospermum erythrorhizon TaxID=34254 RepID=A0AAV3P2L7_LITER
MVISSSPSNHNFPTWVGAATATRTQSPLEFDKIELINNNNNNMVSKESGSSSDVGLGFLERSVSAAGSAVLSAILVNPLDVAKTRLQAQAAGVPYSDLCGAACFDNPILPGMRSHPFYNRSVMGSGTCSAECSRYKGTVDVFYKVVREEGFTRLWRGTNASLALAVPSVGVYLPLYDIFRNLMEGYTSHNAPTMTPYVPLVAGSLARSIACVSCYPVELARTRMQAFKNTANGVKPPGVWKTLAEVISPVNGTNLHGYRSLWIGLGAQLARDVPFSAICWSTLEPVRRSILGFVGSEAKGTTILGANFFAGFVAGTLAAASTCPLDVVRTRRQIENDPERKMRMTTRTTLIEIWRDGGVRGLFAGVGPRVARAGPSVGIVVSLYEVVKYIVQQRRHSTQ